MLWSKHNIIKWLFLGITVTNLQNQAAVGVDFANQLVNVKGQLSRWRLTDCPVLNCLSFSCFSTCSICLCQLWEWVVKFEIVTWESTCCNWDCRLEKFAAGKEWSRKLSEMPWIAFWSRFNPHEVAIYTHVSAPAVKLGRMKSEIFTAAEMAVSGQKHIVQWELVHWPASSLHCCIGSRIKSITCECTCSLQSEEIGGILLECYLLTPCCRNLSIFNQEHGNKCPN